MKSVKDIERTLKNCEQLYPKMHQFGNSSLILQLEWHKISK